MPSTKGNPTDPKLHDKITEEIKQQTNKDGESSSPRLFPVTRLLQRSRRRLTDTQHHTMLGSGAGQMAAWKASKIAKEYEAQGGDYDNESGSKNEPKKG
jgi:hypothetical protein